MADPSDALASLEAGGIVDAIASEERLKMARARLATKAVQLVGFPALLAAYEHAVKLALDEYNEIITANRLSLRVIQGGRALVVNAPAQPQPIKI